MTTGLVGGLGRLITGPGPGERDGPPTPPRRPAYPAARLGDGPMLVGRACSHWEGGCVKRIREALFTLIEAAERNLVVGKRTDCDAAQYGFPREMMARDFHDKAINLAIELLFPGGFRKPAEYPTSQALHVGLKAALDWSANVFYQQMRYWRWGEDDDEASDQLVYSISEFDLGKLRKCLTRLDDEIRRHPGSPTKPPRFESPAPPEPANFPVVEAPMQQEKTGTLGTTERTGFFSDSPPPARTQDLVQLRRLDGSLGTMDPSRASRWSGDPKFDSSCDVGWSVDLYRSKGGRWVQRTTYVDYDGESWNDKHSRLEWKEVSFEEALRWFLDQWRPSSDEERASIPPEIRERIDRMDIDALDEIPNTDRSTEEVPRVKAKRSQAKSDLSKNKDRDLKSEIAGAARNRVMNDRSYTIREIADEVGCSPGYVSKILNELKNAGGSVPRGWKGKDGNVEAIA